jgi:hypothetical protein
MYSGSQVNSVTNWNVKYTYGESGTISGIDIKKESSDHEFLVHVDKPAFTDTEPCFSFTTKQKKANPNPVGQLIERIECSVNRTKVFGGQSLKIFIDDIKITYVRGSQTEDYIVNFETHHDSISGETCHIKVGKPKNPTPAPVPTPYVAPAPIPEIAPLLSTPPAPSRQPLPKMNNLPWAVGIDRVLNKLENHELMGQLISSSQKLEAANKEWNAAFSSYLPPEEMERIKKAKTLHQDAVMNIQNILVSRGFPRENLNYPFKTILSPLHY